MAISTLPETGIPSRVSRGRKHVRMVAAAFLIFIGVMAVFNIVALIGSFVMQEMAVKILTFGSDMGLPVPQEMVVQAEDENLLTARLVALATLAAGAWVVWQVYRFTHGWSGARTALLAAAWFLLVVGGVFRLLGTLASEAVSPPVVITSCLMIGLWVWVIHVLRGKDVRDTLYL